MIPKRIPIPIVVEVMPPTKSCMVCLDCRESDHSQKVIQGLWTQFQKLRFPPHFLPCISSLATVFPIMCSSVSSFNSKTGGSHSMKAEEMLDHTS